MAEIETASVHLTIENFISDPNKLYNQEKETWLDNVIAAKLKAEQDEALLLRATIVADLEKIKTKVMSILRFNYDLGLKYDIDIAIDTRASRYK